MDELKFMSDCELAQRIQEYRNRLYILMSEISKFLSDGTGIRENILDEYKYLKDAVKADANYVDLVTNHNGRANHYRDISRALGEAAAWGFTAPTNSAINRKLFSSIEEAHYKIGKCNPEELFNEPTKT